MTATDNAFLMRIKCENCAKDVESVFLALS